MTASSDSTTSAANAWDSPGLPLDERICVDLIPHDFQWLTPDFLTLSECAKACSGNGNLRTLRPSKNHSTKIKRSRTRLQLFVRENWCRRPAALCWRFSVPHEPIGARISNCGSRTHQNGSELDYAYVGEFENARAPAPGRSLRQSHSAGRITR
jgi:hypothetical protein